MRAYERLLKYVTYHTASAEDVEKSPTTERQFTLARELVRELHELGVTDAECSGACCVYGHLPATPGCEGAPRLGFIAHMDTVADVCGENVRPRVFENYDGGEAALGHGRTLSPRDFPHLASLRGRTLITASGDTLLGADDKAGIAEIMTLIEELADRPHGPLCVAFTPDEEVGRGTAGFDLGRFGADVAYTVDGGPEGELSWENFNAASATVRIKGAAVHTGRAKGTMINAALCAMELNAMLPPLDTPRNTEGYQGFFHLVSVEGCCESAVVRYIIRDHDASNLDRRVETLRRACEALNVRYGEGTAEAEIKYGYRNMREKICPEHMDLVENARAAMRAAGLEPDEKPIRGGTDGAELSWRGLPCPNLGTGGYCYHGPYEHITAEGMDSCVAVLRNIVDIYAKTVR